MLRTKITKLGSLELLEDGGLVCSVVTDQPPSLDASTLMASLYWASPNPDELAIGDLVEHLEHIRKAGGMGQLSKLGARGAKWSQPAKWPRSYLIEALPGAYAWPSVGTFPEFPRERERVRLRVTPGDPQPPELPPFEAVARWRRVCAAYQKAIHANSSYREAAQEYFERQCREPQPLFDWWAYRSVALRVEPIELANLRNRDEIVLLIKQYVLRHDRSIEKMRREVETLENCEGLEEVVREPIPEGVRLFVWQRDKGRCVRCGSQKRLEYDHIIPVIAGGSNTERNIQLLCERCNRSKGATV